MKTPYFTCSHEWATQLYREKFFVTRDEAEYEAKATAYHKNIQYVFELVSIINPPGPEPEVTQA